MKLGIRQDANEVPEVYCVETGEAVEGVRGIEVYVSKNSIITAEVEFALFKKDATLAVSLEDDSRL